MTLSGSTLLSQQCFAAIQLWWCYCSLSNSDSNAYLLERPWAAEHLAKGFDPVGRSRYPR